MYLPGKKNKYISFFLVAIIVFVAIAGAVISAPVSVYALSLGGLKGTIASLIISLLLQTGVAPTNTQWLNQLNSAYGVESSIGTIEDMISSGLLTEANGTLIDTGLSSAIEALPEYNSLGLSDIFSTTATDVGVSVSSGGVNLANSAIHLGKAGTIGAFAGAAALGVGIGVLANHFYNKYQAYIRSGIPITYNSDIINATPEGYRCFYNAYSAALGNGYIVSYYYTPIGMAVGAVKSGPNDADYYGLSAGGMNGNYQYIIINTQDNIPIRQGSNTVSQWGTGLYNYGFQGNWGKAETNAEIFTNAQGQSEYFYNIVTGNTTVREPVSPDIITDNGNAQIVIGNDGNDTINGAGNIVPEGYVMRPVDLDDYLNYANQANDNTENGDTGEQVQGNDFIDFVSPYIIPQPAEPDTPIIPENPSDVPTYPDRPVEPEQPSIPSKPEVSNEDIQQSLEGATTIDLRSVFPFCIPWDIYNLVLIFDTGENREAPHIIFTFPFNDNWVIDVDFAEFDSAAGILRLLELILFVMGLMVATRKLIGAGG